MSLRMRIALFGAGVVLLTVLLFSLLLYGLAARGLTTQQNQALALRATQAAAALKLASRQSLLDGQTLAPVNLVTGADSFVELLDPTGTPTWSSGEIVGAAPAIPAALLTAATGAGHATATLRQQQGVSLRVYLLTWSRPDLGLSGYVVAGQPARTARQQLAGLRTFLLLTALLCLVAAVVANWLALGGALRPLRTMAGAVEQIGRTRDLSSRLPPVQTADEIGLLTGSFNSMLQRLQESQSRLSGALEAQQRFVADASHELRTPLTTIRHNAGFLVQHPDAAPADRDAALADIAAESERMTRLVQELLTLARADAGYRPELAPIDLAPILRDVARQAQSQHPDRRVEAAITGEAAPIGEGNADALTRLLWILVDNAIRHTSAGGRIVLTCGRDVAGGRLELCVADDGPGIPEGEQQRIFERFYQSDSARSSGGAGLGLAIAAQIVAQHHGRISAGKGPVGGAEFRVELP